MADEALARFIEEVCGESHLRVEADLGDGFVRLRSSEAERRQAAHDIRSTEDIVIELLRNARDAHAQHIFLAVTRDGATRRLVVVDDGDGVPPAMHERIFEPRVTSKLDTMHMDKWGVHGRGMALYSVAVNAEQARITASAAGKGTALLVETDLAKVGERRDQSTFPRFELGEGGSVSVRGPRNVLRTACEFAIDCHRTCAVYLGSATDIAAALYAHGRARLSGQQRAFCDDPNDLPVCDRLAIATDPADFAALADTLGLTLSDRSARRIMDGQIAPAGPLLDQVRIVGLNAASDVGSESADGDTPASASAAVYGADPRTATTVATVVPHAKRLKVAPSDLEAFTEDVSAAFRPLARDYYLDAAVEPTVRVSRDAIRITIPVIPQD